ncbi:A/G-specific adenine glycosylase [Pseudosulfitobacter pseudonitzschiae]|uniref:A/G-specific adenine glycosylase n=1 Tax=Pseudosulfitobacter pseudonitzschiae TaxID=1402135 RepID=UPI001E2C20F2|nr:A/G-specific adenine glycosylase [Pseudosulfitobacter pseudonitzschiae]MCD2327931.1 A/G-specific adenine glycosylase [Pseudosulfitobacter pseudonitzschiae]MCD2352371.1 A/G-specific adenine glycosylase [Pseudosulfitobacter pseudonitzschiae]MCI2215004.1 A/G-specific adenine glycosylase [Pseudosulfitobacter pseudonitzschiae]UFF52373.1 A/G-specific adenine glycosylase [Pseudosulfitobacter pseudonitzschiae]UKS87854.1 A/G-specific adenine glycosylase [Pseudosulfitobacter pseudonitzschiae]
MPWRTPPADKRAGTRPDPYAVWLSEVMLQQTTVAAVKDYFTRFTTRWPTVADLAAAEDGDVMAEWAGLGYYARARNLLKCARAVVADHGGQFPADHAALLALPGIGPYTAAAISSIAFDLPHAVLDGNVERVMARIYDEHTPLPAAKPILMAHAEALTPVERPGDYAQAVMDLGATICTPKNPACGICPWRDPCLARQRGTAADLPKKTPKKAKPIRHGTVYVARRPDGAYLLERRPDRGLLGGMLGWPGSDWVDVSMDRPAGKPPVNADWTVLQGEVRHTFTHFHLILTVMLAETDAEPDTGRFMTQAEFGPSDLPTVMRKAFDLTRH